MRSGTFGAVAVALGLVAIACGSTPAADSGPDETSSETPPPSSVSEPATTEPPPAGEPTEPDGATGRTATGRTPPDVDVTKHAIPLDEVYFDTFDGGSVTLADSTPELRARLLDAIPPIDEPIYGDASEGEWLEPTDLVMGYVANGQAYAYPFKILNFHEIVNDEIDGIPVLVSYCPLCRSAVVFDRRVDGDVLEFGNTSALYESDLVMVDRTTGSYWWQVAGTAIVGPLTGTKMTVLPSSVATWSDWQTNHPGTLTLTRDTGFLRPYERDSFLNYVEHVNGGSFVFPVGEAARDTRLPPAALVVGLTVGSVTVAYPVDGLADPINDVVAAAPVVVLPTDGGAGVYSAVVDGDVLEFDKRDGEFVDINTSSSWSPAGIATSGPLEKTALTALPTRTTFWFALVGAFPEVEVRMG